MIYLVREADAGDARSWPGPDMLRPITKKGWRQARALVTLMEGLELERVVSSPWLRCRQTVTPLADNRGLELETDRFLSDCFSVERAMAVIDRFRDRPTLICTHADVMDALVERLGSQPIRANAGSWLRAIPTGASGSRLSYYPREGRPLRPALRRCGLDAVTQLQLVEEVRNMSLDRGLAYMEACGDL